MSAPIACTMACMPLTTICGACTGLLKKRRMVREHVSVSQPILVAPARTDGQGAGQRIRPEEQGGHHTEDTRQRRRRE